MDSKKKSILDDIVIRHELKIEDNFDPYLKESINIFRNALSSSGMSEDEMIYITSCLIGNIGRFYNTTVEFTNFRVVSSTVSKYMSLYDYLRDNSMGIRYDYHITSSTTSILYLVGISINHVNKSDERKMIKDIKISI